MFAIGSTSNKESSIMFTVLRHAFLITVPITTSKTSILNWILVGDLETIKETIYLAFITKAKHKFVSHDNGKSIVTGNFKTIFVWLPHQALHYREILPKCRGEIEAEPSKGLNEEIWQLWEYLMSTPNKMLIR